jgi:hypothetical protein
MRSWSGTKLILPDRYGLMFAAAADANSKHVPPTLPLIYCFADE